MRSWGNREDTFVCDEPLYAHYLRETKLPHPGAEETVAHHESDWRKVVDWLTGPIPDDKTIFYQKQMAHHLLPQIDLNWLDRLTNCFLIRQPSEMVTSLIEFIPEPTIEDTALPQQTRIFERVRQQTGNTPPVLDATDVLQNPGKMLQRLCATLGIQFTDRMVKWPPGIRQTDGIWAKHWYAKVEHTTEFTPYRQKEEPVPTNLQSLVSRCNDLYYSLYKHRITID